MNQRPESPQEDIPMHATQRSGSSPLAVRTALLLHRLRANSRATAAPQGVPQLDVDLNQTQLTGRLAGEPALLSVGDHTVALLSLISQRRVAAVGGGTQVESTLLRLAAWEELAEWCGRALRAGDRIYVEGVLCNADEGVWIAPFQEAIVMVDRLVPLSSWLRSR